MHLIAVMYNRAPAVGRTERVAGVHIMPVTLRTKASRKDVRATWRTHDWLADWLTG